MAGLFGSVRFRITATVTLLFAAVSIVAAIVLLWQVERGVLAQVRSAEEARLADLGTEISTGELPRRAVPVGDGVAIAIDENVVIVGRTSEPSNPGVPIVPDNSWPFDGESPFGKNFPFGDDEPPLGSSPSGDTPGELFAKDFFDERFREVILSDGRVTGDHPLAAFIEDARREALTRLDERSPSLTVPAIDSTVSQAAPGETQLGEVLPDWVVTGVEVPTESGTVELVSLQPDTEIVRAVGVFRNGLLVALPLLVGLIGVSAWFMTGRALRPVAVMTRRVDDISSATLHERLPEPAADDEIARLARTMNGMLERLEGAAALQARFASDASHELRSPVTAIRTEVEVARLHPESADWAAVVDRVLVEDERLERIVDDLLVLARTGEAGASPMSDVDLDDVVRGEAARTRRVPVDTSAVQPARVHGSPTDLERVLRHLLDNAARHASEKVVVYVQPLGERVVVAIDDDGPGVPPEQQARVFERFTRLDEGRARDRGGAGLGLSVVKRLVEGHGGTITVGSAPLGGARFEIVLPAGSLR